MDYNNPFNQFLAQEMRRLRLDYERNLFNRPNPYRYAEPQPQGDYIDTTFEVVEEEQHRLLLPATVEEE
jgi:hypothetical protein